MDSFFLIPRQLCCEAVYSGLGKNCVKKIFMAGAKMKLMLLLLGYILSL
jgi:hypothetical protein